MVNISSQMQGCRALAPVPIYPLLLGMLCSAQVPTETMKTVRAHAWEHDLAPWSG